MRALCPGGAVMTRTNRIRKLRARVLVTKAERAEFARDDADEKYRAKLTEAIQELADANVAFNTFSNLAVDLGPIKGTKAIPITFANPDRGDQKCHPQDAAWDIIYDTLR